jgi:hypothetical protein
LAPSAAIRYDGAVNRALPRWPAILAALALAATAGCAHLAPVPDPVNTVASDKYGTTQQVGGVLVTVRTVGWQSEQLDRLEPYVTPLFVEIKNQGETTVNFTVEDAVLVDNEGNLYRPLPPERLQELLTSASAPPPAPDQADSPFPYDLELLSTLGALKSGSVPPGTQIRGAIYFQRAVDWAEELTLRLPIEGETREFRFRVR